jgi:hypothetical protein
MDVLHVGIARGGGGTRGAGLGARVPAGDRRWQRVGLVAVVVVVAVAVVVVVVVVVVVAIDLDSIKLMTACC